MLGPSLLVVPKNTKKRVRQSRFASPVDPLLSGLILAVWRIAERALLAGLNDISVQRQVDAFRSEIIGREFAGCV
jgi:hypothetical protein